MNSVCVLLSTYNGEKYLTPLLDSVVSQKGVALSVVARDDGSKDNTPSILSRYKEQGKITRLITDSNVGFARSFHRLCTEAVPSDYYAFCDQDDIWDSDKLLCAVEKLNACPNDIPLVYWCAYRSIDKNGKVYKQRSKRLIFRNQYNPLANSLNCNDVRGCTCVFNQKAMDMILTLKEGSYRYHDWTLLLIASAFGMDVHDPEPHISYRCHDTNCYGPLKFNFQSLKRGIKYVFNVELNHNRSKEAQEMLELFGDKLSPEQLHYVQCAANYLKDKKIKKQLLKCKRELNAIPAPMRWFIKFAIHTNKY